MLVGTWCLYLFLWNTQFLQYGTLLNQARLFDQPVPTLWCQEETAPLQLCRAGGQTENSKSFLVVGVQRQLLWLLFPWPKNHPSITFCLFYFILFYHEWTSENTVSWMIVGMLLSHKRFLTVILFQTFITFHSLPFVSSHPLWRLLAFPCITVW